MQGLSPQVLARLGGAGESKAAQGESQKLSFGSFEGRAGTMGRSRKGRTYRKPNGSRYYVPSYLEMPWSEACSGTNK